MPEFLEAERPRFFPWVTTLIRGSLNPATTRAVSSGDASSTTTSSKSGYVCSRTLLIASPTNSAWL